MELLIESIQRHVELTPDQKDFIFSKVFIRDFKRGELMVTPGKVCKYDIFVLTGSIKTYYTDRNGSHHIIQFGIAGWWGGDYNSFIKQVPGILTTEAMEDTTVCQVSYADLMQLIDNIPPLERYFRILVQNAYANFQERTLHNLSMTAEERYVHFKSKYPTLDLHLPQKEIAAYLGMSAEFLSKIKKRLLYK